MASGGRTVFFVSHNLKAVEVLCTRVILLEHGKIVADGKPTDVIATYKEGQESSNALEQADFQFPLDSSKSGQITRVRVLNRDGVPTLRYSLLDPIKVEMEFILRRDFQTLILSLHVWGSDNTLVMASEDSDWENFVSDNMRDLFPRAAGHYRASIQIPAPLLNQGRYELEFVLTRGPMRVDTQRGIYFERRDDGTFLSYVSKANRGGLLAVPIPWELRRDDQSIGRVAPLPSSGVDLK